MKPSLDKNNKLHVLDSLRVQLIMKLEKYVQFFDFQASCGIQKGDLLLISQLPFILLSEVEKPITSLLSS